jgi:DAK2 domain fusion protein YloV
MGERETAVILVRGAVAALELARARVDDLNVYPVPDGDTGTNMLLTARAVAEALAGSEAEARAALAEEATRAALLGARGNSGVILSQIVRGAAAVLGEPGEIDPARIARAFRAASDEAYAALREPVEGTILTVSRELADEAYLRSEAGDTPAGLMRAVVRRGEEAVARTPEQLDVLREAGVVDAGGAGLVELVRGLAAAVAGEELPEPPPAAELAPGAVHLEPSRYRYCTTFVVEGDDLDATSLERALEQLGDSLIVVGDRKALKAHVHTDEPEAALALGRAGGSVDGIEIADMRKQAEERERRLSGGARAVEHCAVVAVAAGAGIRGLFERLGAARVVEGGQSMNPSAAELLAAADDAPSEEAVLLPDNGNVILAAEQAARLAEKPVRVLATRSVQAGLAAMIAFDPGRSAEQNAAEMAAALAGVVTGEVTTASRDATVDGISVRAGEFLGLLDDRAVAVGEDFAGVARAVADALLEKPRDVLTLLTGDGAPSLDVLLEELAEGHPELEIEVHDGGQPHYPLLLSAE